MTDTLEIIRGDDVAIGVKFKDEDGDVNITGGVVFFTVKENIEDKDDDALVAKEVAEHTKPTEGETVIDLLKEDTEIKPGTYYWDLQLLINDKIVSTKYGNIKVVPDITRRTNV